MTRFSETDLAAYRRRNPGLFPDDPAPCDAPTGYRPRSVSNGYASEAAFQEDAKARLESLGWHVQEGPKGSAGGGAVWYGEGWPDLTVYGPQRRMWFAELKQPGNRPSEAQLACHARLRECGFRVVVAWTLDELLAIEAEEGAP